MEDLNKLAKYLQGTIIEKIINNIPRKAKLEKRKISGTTIYKSPEVAAEKYNISRCLYFDKYNEMVIKFSEKLDYNFPHCNLSSFYNNMKNVEVFDRIKNWESLMIKLRKSFGGYDTVENKIYLMNLKSYERFEKTLNHELLHLSTRKKIGNIILNGFSQLDKSSDNTFGNGLNEGYTEYLNQKYFSKIDTESYAKQRIYSQKIEKVVGSKKMEQLYFDSNLYGLIEELEKYCTKEEAVNLISKIDSYYLTTSKKRYQKIDAEILNIIDRIHRNKMTKEMIEKENDEEDQLNVISMFDELSSIERKTK